MKENSKKIKMFDYPILNMKILKKKIPFILGDGSHSKFNLNLKYILFIKMKKKKKEKFIIIKKINMKQNTFLTMIEINII